MRADKSADQYGWVNLVKLVGMCLIVLYHARRSIEAVGWHDTSLAIAVSDAFILTLVRPFAIPGFFLVSGVLIAGSLRRDWQSVHAARIDRFFCLFYLWGAIYALTIPVSPFAGIDLEQTAARFVSLIAVDSHAWYVWATAAFFVVAWAMRRWPGWAAVAATVVFSVIVPPMAGKASHPVEEMVRCLPYFMFAVRYPRIPQAIAADATALRLIVLLLAYAGSVYWLVTCGIHHTIVTDAISLVTLVTGTGLAARHWPDFAARCRWFADRTLGLYLLHFPMLVVVGALTARFIPEPLLASSLVPVLFIVATAAAVGLLALLACEALMRIGPTWLFDVPRFRLPERLAHLDLRQIVRRAGFEGLRCDTCAATGQSLALSCPACAK